jgi:Flp pilus assembly protein protease CpaA
MNRMQNSNTFYLHQAIVSFWVLTLVSAGIITLSILLYMQASAGSRRPGFNLHEI